MQTTSTLGIITKNKVDRFLYYFLYASLFIDLISGAVMNVNRVSISIGQIIKTPVLILLIFRIIQNKRLSHVSLFLIIYIVFISINVSFNIWQYNLPSLYANLFTAIKPLFFFTIYFWVKLQILDLKITFDQIQKIVNVNTFIIIINQLIGLTGIGYPSYFLSVEKTLGTTGFFYSGNEYGAIMLAVFSLKLYFLYEERKKYKYFFGALVLFIIALSTAIKTPIIGILFFSLVIPLLSAKNKLFKIGSIIILLFVILLIINLNLNLQLDFIDRLKWIYANKGLVPLIFSGRDIMLKNALDFFVNKYNLLEQLIGIGYFRLNYYISHPEMDMFDILFMYGLIGVCLIYIPFFAIIANHIRLFKVTFSCRYVSLVSIIFLFTSFIAGHTIFSVALSPFLAIILNITKIKRIKYEHQ